MRDEFGRSVKVMVVAGRAAGGAWALGSGFLTTTLRLRVSFGLSKRSPPPKSRPSRKSSSSCTGLGLDLGDCSKGLSSAGAAGLSTRGDRGDAVGSAAGDGGKGDRKGDDGNSMGVVDVGAEVGGCSRC